MQKYEYLIVGSGLFGAVFARQAHEKGKTCLVIEKRPHTGGNIHCEAIEGVTVHQYGAHIFHTNREDVWDYVNQFVTWNRYTNSPIANYKGELYNLPFNMNTFYQMWGVRTPKDAQKIIQAQRVKVQGTPKNLEEQAIMLVGKDIYEKLIKGYTEKQWGRACKDLPSFIIKRLPVRYTFDNNYFETRFQGVPIGGYNQLTDALLDGIEVRLRTDFFEDRETYLQTAGKVIYTGTIDSFFDYEFGELEYRSLRFEHEICDEENHQGVAVMNYTDRETPYTWVIEHKHFEFGTQKKTVLTKEYPISWKSGMEPYYPVNDEKNSSLFKKYRQEAVKLDKVIFGGRLGNYQYYDMDQVFNAALKAVSKEFGE